MMRLEFKDGSVHYFPAGSFCLLDSGWDDVRNYWRMSYAEMLGAGLVK
jgi:hypothetical protein